METTVSAIEIGTVEFILIWERDDEVDGMYAHKYEVTLAHFDGHTEMRSVVDSLGLHALGGGRIKKLSGEWMRIHSILSSRGLLQGR